MHTIHIFATNVVSFNTVLNLLSISNILAVIVIALYLYFIVYVPSQQLKCMYVCTYTLYVVAYLNCISSLFKLLLCVYSSVIITHVYTYLIHMMRVPTK